MSRIGRIAQSLVASSDGAANRIAVRPFPVTGEMKKIVEVCSDKLYKILNKIEPPPSPPPFLLYSGTIFVKGHSIELRVVVDLKPFQSETAQARDDSEKGEVEVYINLPPSFTGGGGIYKKPEFWKSFKIKLLHELIHSFDPKLWVPSIRDKMPEYVNPLHGDFEKYINHPLETSANQGEVYYYFVDAFEHGLSLNEAIRKFFQEPLGNRLYLEVMRRKDSKSYDEYKTRIYKSAEQAYEDVVKERK